VSANRRPDRRFRALCDLARRRVNAVLACIDVLLPGADVRTKRRIANRILTLCDGKNRAPKISAAQAQDVVQRHIQCISRNCPLLIFSEPLARELNQFFEEE
jgi:hypothetical protein